MVRLSRFSSVSEWFHDLALRRGVVEHWTGEDKAAPTGEVLIYLRQQRRPKLKLARESLAFSVFLWANFSWNRSYCDSCPLPVGITSPGTRSSSRADSSPRPTPFPPEPTVLVYGLFRRPWVPVCLLQCKYRREVIFCTRYPFPSNIFSPVFFLWFLQ